MKGLRREAMQSSSVTQLSREGAGLSKRLLV